jgi:hypothetical protein
MKNSKLDMKMTISRPIRHDRSYISVSLKDVNSGIEFLDVEVELADFANMITGLGFIDVKAQVRGLEHVGKIYESQPAQVTILREVYNEIITGPYEEHKKQLGNFIDVNHSLIGWTNDTYLGSQKSIVHSEDNVTLNFRRFRYVEAK